VTAARSLEAMASEVYGGAGSGMGGPRAGYLIDLSDEPRPGVVVIIQPPVARDPQQRPGAVIDVTPNEPDDDPR
jgi:hypothetical protein